MSFDPFTATWAKFLHSEPVCTPRGAIDALLEDSGKELAKLLSASGNTIPFQGMMEQTLTVRRRGQRRDNKCNFGEAEHPVEVFASGKPLVDKAPVEETVIEDINEHKHPPPEEEPAEDDWERWRVVKTNKNGGKKADPESPEVEPIVEELAPLEDEWSFDKKKDKKKSKSDVVVKEPIEEPVADVVPDDDFGWSNSGKKKIKRKRAKNDVVFEEPIEEPAADVVPDDEFGWASFGKKDIKKKKKKKGKAVVEEPYKDEEPVEPPELEPEDDMGWANAWGKKRTRKARTCPSKLLMKRRLLGGHGVPPKRIKPLLLLQHLRRLPLSKLRSKMNF